MQTQDALAAGIHRTIAAALAPHVYAAANARLAAYQEALSLHDWSFQYADDSRVYDKGRVERAWLMLEAAVIDADFAVWNSYAPDNCQRAVAPPPDVAGALAYCEHLTASGTPHWRAVPMAAKMFGMPAPDLRVAYDAVLDRHINAAAAALNEHGAPVEAGA